MARFSSSRHSLHRHLRFSGLRKGDDSPLGSLLLRAKPNAFLIPRSSIQNRRLCDPNVTYRIRLLLFDAVSSWRSLKIYQDVLVVMHSLQKSGGEIYDAVVLTNPSRAPADRRNPGSSPLPSAMMSTNHPIPSNPPVNNQSTPLGTLST